MSKNEDELPIEEAMTRLETLVGEMEEGQLPLEKLLGHYEEGIRLVRVCQQKLESAEQRIQVIKKKAGSVSVEEFSIDNEAE